MKPIKINESKEKIIKSLSDEEIYAFLDDVSSPSGVKVFKKVIGEDTPILEMYSICDYMKHELYTRRWNKCLCMN